MNVVVTSGKAGDRLYVLLLDPASGKLTIDDAFHDSDGRPGLDMSRTWPHGWTGVGKPHGAVFSR